jgi:hypothetical protein
MLSFEELLDLVVFLGLKLPNFGTVVSLGFAIFAVSMEVSGAVSHDVVSEFSDVDVPWRGSLSFTLVDAVSHK